MRLSVQHSLQYPLFSSVTKKRLVILLLLSCLPFVGSFLITHFATAAVSVVTIERDESAPLPWEELLSRFVRSLFAGLVTFLYLVPALVGLYFVGFSFFTGGDVTWPVLLLSFYILLVVSAWPLAVLHAVTTGHVWNALHLPKIVWIGLKVDFVTFLKLLVLSAFLFGMKTFVYLMSWAGFGLLLIPTQAYTEYVFQYALATAYSSAIRPVSRLTIPGPGAS